MSNSVPPHPLSPSTPVAASSSSLPTPEASPPPPTVSNLLVRVICGLLVGALLGAINIVELGDTLGRFRPRPAAEDRAAVTQLLAEIPRIPGREQILGYERSRFGAGWVTTPSGCSTRQDMIVSAFGADVASDPCFSPPGAHARDPYTGRILHMAADADIDHVVPLAAAWDLGAWQWDEATRIRFANDQQRNLIVTAAEANREKSDQILEDWLPSDGHYHCEYTAKYLNVIAHYSLPITEGDARAAMKACRLPGWWRAQLRHKFNLD